MQVKKQQLKQDRAGRETHTDPGGVATPGVRFGRLSCLEQGTEAETGEAEFQATDANPDD